MRVLISGAYEQLGRALVAALAVASGILLFAACRGDDASNRSEISQGQIEAWANEVWEVTFPEVRTQLTEGCPEDPSQTPSLSIVLTGGTSIEFDMGISVSPGTALPEIPDEAQPAVGRLLAEKIYEFCRSQTLTPAAFFADQIQQWADELIDSGGAVVRCPSATNTGVVQKPAVSVGFDAESDIPEEAQAAVAQRAGEMLRDTCDPTPR